MRRDRRGRPARRARAARGAPPPGPARARAGVLAPRGPARRGRRPQLERAAVAARPLRLARGADRARRRGARRRQRVDGRLGRLAARARRRRARARPQHRLRGGGQPRHRGGRTPRRSRSSTPTSSSSPTGSSAPSGGWPPTTASPRSRRRWCCSTTRRRSTTPATCCAATAWPSSAGTAGPTARGSPSPARCSARAAGRRVYRRSALVAVGLLDERLFAYLEDVDLGLRLRLAGWRCAYEPVVARHARHGSDGPGAPSIDALVARNTLVLVGQGVPAALAGAVAYRQAAWAARAAGEGRLLEHLRGVLVGAAAAARRAARAPRAAPHRGRAGGGGGPGAPVARAARRRAPGGARVTAGLPPAHVRRALARRSRFVGSCSSSSPRSCRR